MYTLEANCQWVLNIRSKLSHIRFAFVTTSDVDLPDPKTSTEVSRAKLVAKTSNIKQKPLFHSY